VNTAVFTRGPVGFAPKAHTVGFIAGAGGEADSVRTNNEVPEGFVVLDGKVESWARLMAAASD
jgi:hypothetical protein